MPVKVHLRHLRISPRKVRLVIDLIRGAGAEEAESQLRFLPKKAALPVIKLLHSAIAAADHDFKLDKKDLYISKIYVDEGPTLKRFMPRAMGRAAAIHKRTSHITLVLDNRNESVNNIKTEAKSAAEKNDKKKSIIKSK